MSTVSEMSEKAPLLGLNGWPAMACMPRPYEQIANWAFVDWMLNFREETILSTIKIRPGRFLGDCIDTHPEL